MKNFYGLMVLFILTLTGCSQDDKATVYNDAAGTNDVILKANCPINALNSYGLATPGQSINIFWDQVASPGGQVPMQFNSYIETYNCGLGRTVRTPIDIVNAQSKSINTVSSCYNWRIVVNGYYIQGQTVCTTTTPWVQVSF